MKPAPNNTPNVPPRPAGRVGTWDGGDGKPSWIREDGSHDAEAHTAELNRRATDPLKYANRVPGGGGKKNRDTHSYQQHPDGTARVRWQASDSTLSFPDWCEEQGLVGRP